MPLVCCAYVLDLYVMCACVLHKPLHSLHPCNWRGLPCITALSVTRELREEMYRAYITRASAGEGDNTPIIERTLALRREQAALLGFANYAELSMASKVRAVRSGTRCRSTVAVCLVSIRLNAMLCCLAG